MIGERALTDEEIISRIRTGEERMLVLLYKRNQGSIRSYILSNSGTISDVEDVMQESLVVLWQKVQPVSFVLTSKIDTFLFAIAKNVWLKILRRQKNLKIVDEDQMPDLSDTELNNEEKLKRIQILTAFIDKLSETCRQILSLFYFEEWDMERIAAKLNFSNADTVKAKKYQCKKKLEEMIRLRFKVEDL